MSVTIHDRDEWQRRRKAEARAAAEERARNHRKIMQLRRRNQIADFFTAIPDVIRALWTSIWHMGMYSQDPYLARIAMVHTAQEQLQLQRQMAAQQRLQERADREEEARILARTMVQEMRAEIRREQANGQRPPDEQR